VGVLLLCPYALALDPSLDVSQYAHTSWKIRDGFSKGEIHDVAQTSDGYLWLGTGSGVLRFDGVRNVPWQPPSDQHLPSSYIRKLLPARDGTLWIGTWKGLASWRSGKLTRYPELAGLAIYAILEDHDGSIWAGALGPPEGKLCEIRDDRVHCHPEIGGLAQGVFDLHEDGQGNFWVGLLTGVWRWKPGPPEFYPVPGQLDGIRGMVDGEDGALLVSTIGGVRRLVDGKVQVAYPLPATMQEFRASGILRDRDGGLWVATSGRGIVHIHQGRTDVFSQSDGLSGDFIHDLFEDREGNIWVATMNGLDRFRNLAVVTYSTKQGSDGAVLGARDGSIWFGTYDGLDRLNNGQVTVYRQRSIRAIAGVREVAVSGLPDHGLGSLFQDSVGRIWVGTRAGVGYLDHNRFISTAVPGGTVGALTADSTGNLWIVNQNLGLFRLSPSNEVQRFPWVILGHKDPADPLALDPFLGGLWLGFYQGGVVYFRDGQVRASYSADNGLGEGQVNDLRIDRDGTLWAATQGGLSRLKNGRVATLSSKNGLPCDTVHWTIEDDDHSVWLYMACGLVRIARSELDAWAAASEPRPPGSGPAIHVTVFDSSDGVRTVADLGTYTPHVAKSNGRLWFSTPTGLSVIDPRHLPFNKLSPPVHIEQLIADRKTYQARLPPLVRDLEIDYTALSFVAPEKVRFRYKLEGHDRDWQDAGTRRQAFYNDLPPRDYHFRVTACNNSGVWNEAGASLDFSIDPAYYQTTWFRLLLLAAFLAVLAAMYQLRVRYLRRQFNIRLEERVGERTRIARDLHDTLLQSFHGVLLKFHAATNLLPGKPDEAKKTLETVINQARQVVVEGRDTVYGLRSSTVTTNDLARSISSLGEELATGPTGQSSPCFQVRVEGKAWDLHPIVRDEVNRIACEAVRNAFLHAQAGRIEVEIRYDERQLRLRVRDDGKGMDPNVLDEGRAGHYGLPGMRERAKLIGGKLAVSSELDSGTEVELTVPASAAYAKSPVSIAAHKARGTD
jgi:signal transduction histidine kinase/ligand-binding sensor domain-containing protein